MRNSHTLSRSSAPQAGRTGVLVAVVACLALAGCRQDMHDQAKIEPFEEADFFPDQVGARPIPQFTVSRGNLEADVAFYTGYDESGTALASLPEQLELTPELLDRGQQRYEIFCSPCHASTGTGRGMIVERGFAQPPSYHEERLREMPLGYFYDVATNGYGLMSGYKAQTKPSDRWAIAAWIRVLQRARYAPADSLDAADREKLAGIAMAPAPSDDNHGGGEDHGEEHDGEEHASLLTPALDADGVVAR